LKVKAEVGLKCLTQHLCLSKFDPTTQHCLECIYYMYTINAVILT